MATQSAPRSIDYMGPPSWEGLAQAGLRASLDFPGHYIVAYSVGFSTYALSIRKSLSRSARSLASNSGPLRDGYWLNGKRRRWTKAQVIADQQDWR